MFQGSLQYDRGIYREILWDIYRMLVLVIQKLKAGRNPPIIRASFCIECSGRGNTLDLIWLPRWQLSGRGAKENQWDFA